jgi:hypothetical protein
MRSPHRGRNQPIRWWSGCAGSDRAGSTARSMALARSCPGFVGSDCSLFGSVNVPGSGVSFISGHGDGVWALEQINPSARNDIAAVKAPHCGGHWSERDSLPVMAEGSFACDDK